MTQFLLVKLMEECAELSQRASKTIQFGELEIQSGQEKTNMQRLQNEFDDLLVMAIWCGLDPNITYEKVMVKKEKVFKYLEYSIRECELKIDD